MVGLRIAEAWTVWNLDLDKWFADLPVVLRFANGPQLEICWEKFDDLSITWDTIDLTVTPRAWVEWPLEWRPAADPAVVSVLGAAVTGVSATMFRFTTRDVDRPSDFRSTWLTSGLWFEAGDVGLHVFNGLDENGLSSTRPDRSGEHDFRAI